MKIDDRATTAARAQVRRWMVTALVGIVVVGAAYWWLFPSVKRQVLGRTEALARALAVSPKDRPGELGQLADAARIGLFFTADARVEAEGEHQAIEGRDMIVALAARVRAGAREVRLTLGDPRVEVGADRRSARLTAEVSIYMVNAASGEESSDRREVQMEWRKVDRAWLVERARVLAVEP